MKQNSLLLIHLDQLRYDCLACYGNEQIQTPHIDEFCKDSKKFTNHFTCYPVCTPSRYSLLSGLDVQYHNGWTNHSTLSHSFLTLPRVLRDVGYNTTAVGKMHFTPTYLDVGFDKMVLCEQDGPGRWDDDYHRHLMNMNLIDVRDTIDQREEYRKNAKDEYYQSFGAQINNLPLEETSTAWIGKKALEELYQWDGNPNFLMVGFVKPHHPFDPSKLWASKYNPEDMKLLGGWSESCLSRDINFNSGYFDHTLLTVSTMKKIQAYYYACISEIDHQIGAMISMLKNKGLYESTCIVFTSDHGEYMGYHHMLLKSNYMYDPLMRIPLLIKYPNNKTHTIDNSLSTNKTVAAHILHNLSIPKKYLKGTEFEKDLLQAESKYIFAHSNEGRMAMARNRKYKLLYDNFNKRKILFDLENDPYEIEDLSNKKDYADILNSLFEALNKWQLTGIASYQKPYLNENEKISRTPNASTINDREPVISYYHRHIQKYLKNYVY